MRYLSLFSGIEAATVAWKPLGWTPFAFAEIEKFPAAVLAHHYGSNMPGEALSKNGVPNLGDVNKFKEWPDEPVDLICGGSPCQSFSVAGLRKGMDDPRGNLALVYLAIVNKYRPRWVVYENVPGLLSSNGGRDFGSFVGGMAKLGYGFAYRVLDAQYVRVDGFERAVPQRRRRVFVVGYLGDWRRAAAVLFEPDGLRGNPAPRRKARKATAADVAPSLVSSGRGVERAGDTRGQDPVVAELITNSGDASYCVSVNGQRSNDAETETLVAHALRGEGFDASEDGTGRGTPIVPVAYRTAGDGAVFEEGEVTAPLTTMTDPSANIVAFSSKDFGGDAMENVSPTLRSGGHNASHANAGVPPAIAIQERAVSENPDAGQDGKGIRDDGAAYTLEARTVPQAVAFDMRGRDGGAMLEGPHDTANIRASSGGSSRSYIANQWAVRRLTPTECHRLQGFPDGFCDIPWRGNDHAPDGPQYKALGNSMAVNVMRWIGRRIEIVERITSAAEAV